MMHGVEGKKRGGKVGTERGNRHDRTTVVGGVEWRTGRSWAAERKFWALRAWVHLLPEPRGIPSNQDFDKGTPGPLVRVSPQS